jgi:hypothetical protein
VSGDVPAGRGDVGGPDDVVAAESQVAQGGHVRGAMPVRIWDRSEAASAAGIHSGMIGTWRAKVLARCGRRPL